MSQELIGYEITQPGSNLEPLAELDRSGAAFIVLPQSADIDPLVAAGWLAARTVRSGLLVEASAELEHPYHSARRLSSLDHLSRGRVGWLTGRPEHTPSKWLESPSTEHVWDAVRAVRRLWRTWPIESIIGDREGGQFADASRVRRADHDGHFRTRGPLCVPTTPQGEPTVWWRWRGEARVPVVEAADVVVVEHYDVRRWAATEGPAVPIVIRGREEDGLAAAVMEARTTTTDRVLGALVVLETGEGVVRGESSANLSATLRERLDIPQRISPDASSLAPAFPDTVGGRL